MPRPAAAQEPHLGWATSEDMMRELICRFKMTQYTDGIESFVAVERALVLAEMLGSMSAPEREYRTVDG